VPYRLQVYGGLLREDLATENATVGIHQKSIVMMEIISKIPPLFHRPSGIEFLEDTAEVFRRPCGAWGCGDWVIGCCGAYIDIEPQ
jgi:hypothetical protein